VVGYLKKGMNNPQARDVVLRSLPISVLRVFQLSSVVVGEMRQNFAVSLSLTMSLTAGYEFVPKHNCLVIGTEC
jgi:hypothetical protein